ncbi:hypothetical protein FLJC2902T_29620 [Flavobacterium limnosediminis JC2902]|uniref:NodB homology domain-containing protein n=1 Tax=Flavobacterium limnosediminis JC2902 TaxID=1341181 RepID=V6SH93_9FLAO|nr:hypothetical protein FLJC2902T_29620 [Flavobacterium limnosediminis JC2902]
MKLLKKIGDFITSNELITNLDSVLSSNDNYLFVTFDDGLKEQFDHALPILEELDIPAIFFANSRNFEEKKVSTVHKIHLLRSILAPNVFLEQLACFKMDVLNDVDAIRAKEIYRYDDDKSATLKYLLNFKLDFRTQEAIIKSIFDLHFDENTVLDELYMNEENIIDLAKRGYLGSHTHSHFPVGLLDAQEIRFELSNSKLYFEKLTDSIINMTAYPYGTDEACTDEVASIAKTIGYQAGFTTKRGTNTKGINRLLMNRFDCNDLPGGKNYIK